MNAFGQSLAIALAPERNTVGTLALRFVQTEMSMGRHTCAVGWQADLVRMALDVGVVPRNPRSSSTNSVSLVTATTEVHVRNDAPA